MVVVTIAGILATLAFVSLRKHSAASKRVEPLSMVQSIRAAQERWRAQYMMYLNVSTENNWYPRSPLEEANRFKIGSFMLTPEDGHPDNARWQELRPTSIGNVQFGYITKAGIIGQQPPAPSSGSFPGFAWPVATDNWYVIEAFGDTDWDGTRSAYLAGSISGEVLSVNDGE